MQIVGDEAEQKSGVDVKIVIWCILMKNDGMLSIGKPGHFGEKSQKFNHSNKQIKERDHITNENGACQISGGMPNGTVNEPIPSPKASPPLYTTNQAPFTGHAIYLRGVSHKEPPQGLHITVESGNGFDIWWIR